MIAQIHLAETFSESIGKATANLFQDVPLVIVPQRTCDFVVGHLWPVTVLAP